jgi:hypothetical protein
MYEVGDTLMLNALFMACAFHPTALLPAAQAIIGPMVLHRDGRVGRTGFASNDFAAFIKLRHGGIRAIAITQRS